MEVLAPIITLVTRIVGVSVCTSKAEKLNRSKTRWGLFGFFLPIIAMIWVQFMKPIVDWEEGKID